MKNYSERDRAVYKPDTGTYVNRHAVEQISKLNPTYWGPDIMWPVPPVPIYTIDLTPMVNYVQATYYTRDGKEYYTFLIQNYDTEIPSLEIETIAKDKTHIAGIQNILLQPSSLTINNTILSIKEATMSVKFVTLDEGGFPVYKFNVNVKASDNNIYVYTGTIDVHAFDADHDYESINLEDDTLNTPLYFEATESDTRVGIVYMSDFENLYTENEIMSFMGETPETDDSIENEEDSQPVKLRSSDNDQRVFEYSLDNKNWLPYSISTIITLENPGDKIYFRGNNKNINGPEKLEDFANFNEDDMISFYASKNVYGKGNIMSLLDSTMKLDTVPVGCFMHFFIYSIYLLSSPELPADTVAPLGYGGMFYLSGITEAPVLPATIVEFYAYSAMFALCPNLVKVPTITCTQYLSGTDMIFYDCPQLNYIKLISLDINLMMSVLLSIKENTTNGTLVCSKYLSPILIEDIGLPETWHIEYLSDDEEFVIPEATNKTPLNFTAKTNNSSVKFALIDVNGSENSNDSSLNIQLEYSFNNVNWLPYQLGEDIILSNVNDIVYFRGDNSSMFDIENMLAANVLATGQIEAHGNIMSLLDKTCNLMVVPYGGFAYLFANCESLITAPELPGYILQTSSYMKMFSGCSNLIEAPVLAAQYLAGEDYAEMFADCASLTNIDNINLKDIKNIGYESFTKMFTGCTSLTHTPEFPAYATRYSFESMFAGCTSLTDVAPLPNNLIAMDSTYAYMFAGCTLLVNAPELPAKLLMESCYSNMFEGCTSLVNAPELPAIIIGSNCYKGMFKGCTSLTQAPELPLTELSDSCYQEMFSGCTSLTIAPELPATELSSHCYQEMFSGCTSLTIAPELPATELSSHCYQEMFSGCTSLTTAPELHTKQLAEYCYFNMFSGCSALTSLTIQANDISADSCLDGWLDDTAVDTTGTLYAEDYADFTGQVPNNWVIDAALQRPLTFECVELLEGSESGSVILNIPEALQSSISLEYSTDYGTTWTPYAGGTAISTAVGDKVQFRAVSENQTFSSLNNYCKFTFTNAKLKASGNIMSLLDKTMQRTDVPGSAFGSLFVNCMNLLTAPMLPATTLAEYCYRNMFHNCTSLTTTPELPATTLAEHCYFAMFSYCESLTTTPELPVTTLAGGCYKQMFMECISLTTAPELPATTLASHCYAGMFQNCTSLTTIPELPVTTLAEYCYGYMFEGCKSLTTAPELPATMLAQYCYYLMFAYCTSLTTAPELPATTLAYECYNGMFSSSGIKNLPNIIYRLDSEMFSKCDMNSIIIPDTVQSINLDALKEATVKEDNFINNSQVTEGYPWGALLYSQKIDNWYVNDSMYIVGGDLSADMVIPAEIQGIDGSIRVGSEGSQLHSLTILNQDQVIYLGSNSYIRQSYVSGSESIYVPDALVEDYKVATNWNKFAGHVYPLSQKPA